MNQDFTRQTKEAVPTVDRWSWSSRRLWLFALLAGTLVGLGLWTRTPGVQSAAPVIQPQSPTAIVRCDPDPLNGSLGAIVSVTIYVQNGANLYGLDVRMQFDPTYTQVVDADPAVAGIQIQPLAGFLSPDFVVRRTADNDTGLIRYAVTQVAPSPPASGSGAVARIDLRGIQPGAIIAPFTQVDLVRNDGSAIPFRTQACTWQFNQVWQRYLPLVTIR